MRRQNSTSKDVVKSSRILQNSKGWSKKSRRTYYRGPLLSTMYALQWDTGFQDLQDPRKLRKIMKEERSIAATESEKVKFMKDIAGSHEILATELQRNRELTELKNC